MSFDAVTTNLQNDSKMKFSFCPIFLLVHSAEFLTTLSPWFSRPEAGWYLGAAGTESCSDVCTSRSHRPNCLPAAMNAIDSGEKLNAVLSSLGVSCTAGPIPAVNEDAPNFAQVSPGVVGCAYPFQKVASISCSQTPLDTRIRRLCCCGTDLSECPIP